MCLEIVLLQQFRFSFSLFFCLVPCGGLSWLASHLLLVHVKHWYDTEACARTPDTLAYQDPSLSLLHTECWKNQRTVGEHCLSTVGNLATWLGTSPRSKEMPVNPWWRARYRVSSWHLLSRTGSGWSVYWGTNRETYVKGAIDFRIWENGKMANAIINDCMSIISLYIVPSHCH